MSSKRLQDKVCIVTGSSSGLGRAIAVAYALQGAKLVCADLRQGARESISSETTMDTDELIKQSRGQAIFVQIDVSKGEHWQRLVETAVATYERIDVLVNNAGVSMESRGAPLRLHETPDEVWNVTMAVNTTSIFLGSKFVLAQMLKQDKSPSGDRGFIINISSIFGLVGGNFNASYAASKGAVTNLTRTIALDYANDGIHCNALCPGFVQTAIFKDTMENLNDSDTSDAIVARHPLHGAGKPEDVAGAAVFLASSEARWITGVNLPVDGGYTAQ